MGFAPPPYDGLPFSRSARMRVQTSISTNIQ